MGGAFAPTGEGFTMVATISLMRGGFLVISWRGVRGWLGVTICPSTEAFSLDLFGVFKRLHRRVLSRIPLYAP